MRLVWLGEAGSFGRGSQLRDLPGPGPSVSHPGLGGSGPAELRGEGKEVPPSTHWPYLEGKRERATLFPCPLLILGPASYLTTCLGIFIAAHRSSAAWLECEGSWPSRRPWACSFGACLGFVLSPGGPLLPGWFCLDFGLTVDRFPRNLDPQQGVSQQLIKMRCESLENGSEDYSTSTAPCAVRNLPSTPSVLITMGPIVQMYTLRFRGHLPWSHGE